MFVFDPLYSALSACITYSAVVGFHAWTRGRPGAPRATEPREPSLPKPVPAPVQFALEFFTLLGCGFAFIWIDTLVKVGFLRAYGLGVLWHFAAALLLTGVAAGQTIARALAAPSWRLLASLGASGVAFVVTWEVIVPVAEGRDVLLYLGFLLVGAGTLVACWVGGAVARAMVARAPSSGPSLASPTRQVPRVKKWGLWDWTSRARWILGWPADVALWALLTLEVILNQLGTTLLVW